MKDLNELLKNQYSFEKELFITKKAQEEFSKASENDKVLFKMLYPLAVEKLLYS